MNDPEIAQVFAGATCPKCKGTSTRMTEELADSDRWICACGHKWRLPTSQRPVPIDMPEDGVDFDRRMVTTAFTLDGYNIIQNLGVVQGVVVRSRSAIATLGAAFESALGGNITILTELCEKTRKQAFLLMMKRANEMGANAIIGMRYDATEVIGGVVEVLAYGTAVIATKMERD